MDQISMFAEDKNNWSQQVFQYIGCILKSGSREDLELTFSKTSTYDLIGFKEKPADFRIKFGKKNSYFAVPMRYKNALKRKNIEYKTDSTKLWAKITIFTPDDIYKYETLIFDIYDSRLSESLPDGFDCCSLYMHCSDAKKCVQPLKEVYSDCKYKAKLEKGIIFHGKNRNV